MELMLFLILVSFPDNMFSWSILFLLRLCNDGPKWRLQRLWFLHRDGNHLGDLEHHLFPHLAPAQVYIIMNRKGKLTVFENGVSFQNTCVTLCYSQERTIFLVSFRVKLLHH
jgi:hypothetical protein